MQKGDTFKGSDKVFPFQLQDLVSWTVRRTDGSVSRFTLADSAREALAPTKKGGTKIGGGPVEAAACYTDYTGRVQQTHLQEYCDHIPKDPIVEFDDTGEGARFAPLRLYVGDMFGAKKTKDDFDFVIDGGDVISLYGNKSAAVLEGDQELVMALRNHTIYVPDTRVLKIDWADRKAPDVLPEFWVELNKLLYGDVMTCCQGGHGRSGTSFVCLLLVNAPDYDAKDAITHLRAVHCPRAIESVVQHDYINDVAKSLGRKANAHEVGAIKDYKVAFSASTKPTAVRFRESLKKEK